MANMFKSELLAITEDEAQKMSAAITRVTELYEIRILPEKTMAWINLSVTLASVYGPRIAASSLKAKRKKAGPQIVDMPAPQSPIPEVEIAH